MNIINKAVFKLLKETNGSISYSSLCNYVTGKGFLLIELHTDKGDEILKKFGCYEQYADEKGITVIQKAVSFVIIDSTLPAYDKVRVLLHEIGHIELHLSNKSTFADISGVERENQAEIFVYTALRTSKLKPLFAIRLKSVFKYMVLIAVFGVMYFASAEHSTVQTSGHVQHNSIATNISAVVEENTITVEEINDNAVYAMPTGEVFHNADCSYVNPQKARRLTVAEAEKEGLRPCKRCEPEEN